MKQECIFLPVGFIEQAYFIAMAAMNFRNFNSLD